MPRIFLFSFILLFLVFPFAQAQEVRLGIKPPIFNLTMSPGDTWRSQLEIVNESDSGIPVYASVIGIREKHRLGKTVYVPVLDGDKDVHVLARWIDIAPGPHATREHQGIKLPFSVVLPKDAEPGKYLAGIAVGSQPVAEGKAGANLSVATVITSVVSLTVLGDIVEDGFVREFSVGNVFYSVPDALFTLRFENTGNVRVVPRADVAIYNMWGAKRGEVAIEPDDLHFGTVFPGSVGQVVFRWEGESNFFDVGRYKAVVNVEFGDAKKFASEEIHFWIVPIKQVAGVVALFTIFFAMVNIFARFYIRRIFAEELDEAEKETMSRRQKIVHGFHAAFNKGKREMAEFFASSDKAKKVIHFTKRNWKDTIFAAAFLTVIILVGIYFLSVFTETREFTVDIREMPAETEESALQPTFDASAPGQEKIF